MRLIGILAAVAGTSSCTLLFAPPGSGGGDEGGVDGGDGLTTVSSVAPDVVEEGRGGLEDPGQDGAPLRGVPLVVYGERIPQGAEIEVEWDQDRALLLGDTVVGAGGTLAAAPLGVPVLSEVGRGEAPVEIRVRLTLNGGLVGEPQIVEMIPLGELVHDASGAREVEMLEPRYARIEITQTLILNGGAPARLVANERLLVDALVRARGDGSVPGPGGCTGGAGGSDQNDMQGQEGLCGQDSHQGNGAGGEISEGGGGGGHLAQGERGKVASEVLGGEGGDPQGSAHLFPLIADRGYGGGGGGGTEGGQGGAGGGVVVLSSFGELRLQGPVNVNGAQGGSSMNGGGGGGGAGGAVLLRARGGFSYDEDALLTARGGAGGSGSNLSANEGGAGSGGRVRFDGSASGNPSNPVGEGTAFSRGPFWRTGPIVTREELELEGAFEQSYDVYVGSQMAKTVAIDDPSGVTFGIPELEPGLNRVCALVPGAAIADVQPGEPGAAPPHPEAGTCLDVAYVP